MKPMVILDAGHGIDTKGKHSPIFENGMQLIDCLMAAFRIQGVPIDALRVTRKGVGVVFDLQKSTRAHTGVTVDASTITYSGWEVIVYTLKTISQVEITFPECQKPFLRLRSHFQGVNKHFSS